MKILKLNLDKYKNMRNIIESVDNHQTRHKLNMYMYCYICIDTFYIVGV